MQEQVRAEFGEEALMRRLGELGKLRREALNLGGRAKFGKKAGLSDQTVKNFERAERFPRGVTMRKLEAALGWKQGILNEKLKLVDRKASTITMEELVAPLKPAPARELEDLPTAEILDELMARLSAMRTGVELAP